MDPLTAMSCTLDEIRAMTIELLEAHKPWISCLKGSLEDKALAYNEPAPDRGERHIDPATANKQKD